MGQPWPRGRASALLQIKTPCHGQKTEDLNIEEDFLKRIGKMGQKDQKKACGQKYLQLSVPETCNVMFRWPPSHFRFKTPHVILNANHPFTGNGH